MTELDSARTGQLSRGVSGVVAVAVPLADRAVHLVDDVLEGSPLAIQLLHDGERRRDSELAEAVKVVTRMPAARRCSTTRRSQRLACTAECALPARRIRSLGESAH